MELYLVRHGIAQDRNDPGVGSDAERALTPEGVERTREAAEGLRRLGCKVDRIGTSPLRRADETARILHEVLGGEATFEVCDFLAGGPVCDLVGWLRGLEEERVCVVGHMPDLAEYVSALTTRGDSLDIVFKKAATCCVYFSAQPDKGRGTLLWLMQPAQLRAAGDSKGV